MTRSAAILALLACCGLSVSVAVGADPNQTYESLYGIEARKAEATPGKADDVALASKLLRGAGDATDDPALQVLLYVKAHQLGLSRPDGYITALAAAYRLAFAQPARKAEWEQKVLEVLKQRYLAARGRAQLPAATAYLSRLLYVASNDFAAGRLDSALARYRLALPIARKCRSSKVNEIPKFIQAAVAQQKANRRIAELEKALAARPDDRRSAARLLQLHLIENDDPNKAAGLLNRAEADEATRMFVPMACKDWSSLNEQACLELAGWYHGLCARGGALGRERMLRRAKAYYGCYLVLHGADDGPAIRAKEGLRKVDRELSKYTVAVPSAVGLPSGVTPQVLAWTKQRDSLSPKDQVAALGRQLIAMNPGSDVEIKESTIDRGHVRTLYVQGDSRTESVTPLYGMKLTSLTFADSSVTGVEPLRGMPLTSLRLAGSTSLRSLTGLEGMPLRKIRLDGSRVVSLEPLRGQPLREVAVPGCKQLESFVGLEGAPLRRLQAEHCAKVDDLTPLTGMPLEWLSIAATAVADLRPLRGMPLAQLNCDSTPITSLAPLSETRLKKLNVASCKKLRSLSGIEGLRLEELILCDTKFAQPKIAEMLKKKIPTLREVKVKWD